MAMDRITVQEAARRLGVKDDAIRKRIQRGTIEHDKDQDGRVYVYMAATHDGAEDVWRESTRYAAHDATQGTTEDVYQVGILEAKDETISELREQLGYLRDVLKTRDEEIRRRDHLLAAALERVPHELEAHVGSRNGHESGSEIRPGVDPAGDDAGREKEKLRPWWRRLLGS